MTKDRCPSCGALVGPDAEWCGQCFASLRRPEPGPEAPRPERTPIAATGKPAPGWPCPVCEHRNTLEVDVCGVCGTPFSRLLQEGEPRPVVEPRRALARSLLFPGLGHAALGRGIEGLTRAMLFAWTFGIAVLLLLIDTRGPTTALLVLSGTAAVVSYAGSAFEAYAIAGGGRPLVSPTALLWGTAALVGVSALLLGMAVVSAPRR